MHLFHLQVLQIKNNARNLQVWTYVMSRVENSGTILGSVQYKNNNQLHGLHTQKQWNKRLRAKSYQLCFFFITISSRHKGHACDWEKLSSWSSELLRQNAFSSQAKGVHLFALLHFEIWLQSQSLNHYWGFPVANYDPRGRFPPKPTEKNESLSSVTT